MLSALSDPFRRALVERLSRRPAPVRGLAEPFGISQQMIAKYTVHLVRARIVTNIERGRGSVCTLRPEAIEAVGDWALIYRRLWEESFDGLVMGVSQIGYKSNKEGGGWP